MTQAQRIAFLALLPFLILGALALLVIVAAGLVLGWVLEARCKQSA